MDGPVQPCHTVKRAKARNLVKPTARGHPRFPGNAWGTTRRMGGHFPMPARVPRCKRLVVRPRWRLISTVEVRVRVSHSSVADDHCVTARWGGEQSEANPRSAGGRTRFGGMARRACNSMAKSETHRSRCRGEESDDRGTSRGWRWNEGTVRRRKWGDLRGEVTLLRSQSPHGTAHRSRHTLGRR